MLAWLFTVSVWTMSASPIPGEVTLDHFRELVTARGSHGELLFLRHALNSALVALLTTVVGVGLSCTAAYSLSRFRFPGRRLGLTRERVRQIELDSLKRLASLREMESVGAML